MRYIYGVVLHLNFYIKNKHIFLYEALKLPIYFIL